jgi:hypothetical protein
MSGLANAFHQLYFEKDSTSVNSDARNNLVGERFFEVMTKAVKKAPVDFEKYKLPCAHVSYKNLTSDPIGTIKAIYLKYGWIVTAAYETILLNYVEENNKKRLEVQQRHSSSTK